MTGKEFDEYFGQQEIKDPERVKVTINTFNYKLMDLAQLADLHLPDGPKKDLFVMKLKELKATLDSLALN